MLNALSLCALDDMLCKQELEESNRKVPSCSDPLLK